MKVQVSVNHGLSCSRLLSSVSSLHTYLVMFLEYLAEAGEVERLIVLQQNQTEVELTERQLNIMHRPVHGFVHAALHR